MPDEDVSTRGSGATRCCSHAVHGVPPPLPRHGLRPHERGRPTAVALLSNNPDKAAQLEGLGITVADRQPTGVYAREANRRYLETKVLSTGHTIDLPMPLLAA